MNLELVMRFIKILTLLHTITAGIQASNVPDDKLRVQHEVGNAQNSEEEFSSIRRSYKRVHHHRNRWSGRRRFETYFTPWTAWTECDGSCRRRRERYCRVKRKCGYTKHLEEKKCFGCHPQFHQHVHENAATIPPTSISNHVHTPIVITQPTAPPAAEHVTNHFRLPVFQEIKDTHHRPSFDGASIEDDSDDGEFYVIKKDKPKIKKRRKPILIEVDDYEELEEEEEEEEERDEKIMNKKFIQPVRLKNYNKAKGKNRRKLKGQGLPDYEESDLSEIPLTGDVDYLSENDYDEDDGNQTRNPTREKAVIDATPRHRRAYTKWSKWTQCSPKCTTRRYKKCRAREICGLEVLREIAYCYIEGSFCQQWLQAEARKSNHNYDLRPAASRREFNLNDTALNSVADNFVMNGRGYRGPEYTPMKLKCGIPTLRNNRRNMYNLLKIIGGRTARKGDWPWQVAIFNRYKEAFCGGTLIAPQWVVTAAHCVRKVLYVKLGEHNLDFDEGTELQFRVTKTYRHNSYDKKTVDSDIALLKLPRPINTTSYIDFACLPRPFQPLPKNLDCTIIGWGKRRNRDQAGTSVIQQAEVPIIPMDNCRSVYHDYSITKNMFCAGHKRGRIDTCAGDSGGPLLCRDATKPNHPWTIFGITSFGDGCAKRNKFGIYVKVPNYVDWIWSVVNCNGNCKANKRL